ncbi:MAG: family permease [Cryobacterium sp.]|jgi:amino acid transporter|nr:family permease [Cryobacterium sp.]
MTALARVISHPPPVPGLAARSPLHGLERRSVGFVDVLAQSVAAVAPSAAATTIPLLVAVVAGGAQIWALVLATALALLVAMNVNQFTKRIAATGSLYTFVSQGLGAGAAFVTGIAMLLGYAFISMFALAGAGYYLAILTHRLWPAGAHSPLGTSVAIAGLAGLVALVLTRGIRLSTRVALVVEAASVAIILVLVGALVAHTGPAVQWSALSLHSATPQNLSVGTVLALTAFVGFESSATLGVEAKRPFATIPRALVWTVVASGVLYLLAAYGQLVGFASLGLDFAGSDSPVNDLANASGLPWMGLLLDLSIAASFLACAIASTTALSRVMFSMGRDGLLPDAFGRTHPVHHTPFFALVVAVPVIAAVPVGCMIAGMGLWDTMEMLIVVAAAGFITAYFMVCAAAPVFLRRIGEHTVGAGAASVITCILLAAVFGVYLVTESTTVRSPGVLLFGAMMVGGVGVYALRLRRNPWLRESIGVHDEPVQHDVLGGAPAESASRAGS